MIRRSYKFKIRRPSKSIVQKFEHTLDLCRELYNAGLQERSDAWRLNRIGVSYVDQANQLKEIKTIRIELKDVYSQVIQDVLKRLDKTYKSFFSRCQKGEKAGFPRFKGKKRFNSFCYPQSGFKLDGDKLMLSKIGLLRIRLSRKIVGKVKTCTIKRQVDGWFVIFAVETLPKELPKTNKQIGVDVGIESFATMSDGGKIPNQRQFLTLQKKLRVAQRRVARRKKESNRRRKAVRKLQKIHLKIKNQRNDFTHKLSRKLVNEFDLIALEDLKVKNMVRNKYLAKQIMDAAWSSFFSKLEYKAENAGREFVKVNPRNTSQNCSGCGIKVKKSMKVRVHKCPECKLEIDRDHNAAINILKLAVGQTVKNVT